MKIFESLSRPQFLRAFHGWMTVIWGIFIPVSVFTSLRESIMWIVLMSVWANFVGHFSSWQATRVETLQDEQMNNNRNNNK